MAGFLSSLSSPFDGLAENPLRTANDMVGNGTQMGWRRVTVLGVPVGLYHMLGHFATTITHVALSSDLSSNAVSEACKCARTHRLDADLELTSPAAFQFW